VNLERSQRYDLVQPIGAGGMGEVFLAVATGAHGFQKRVAVKRIRPGLSADEDFVRRFVAEAKLTVSLTHANIVQVLDLGQFGDELFIVMEYVEGTDLGRLLSTTKQRAEPVPVEIAVHLAVEALSGLAYAHGRRVVHCDVSPSNLLVSVSGEVKLTDFGVARVISQARSGGAVGLVAGKPGYMAPETARGEPVGPAADVYAVGILLFEMLAGARPASPGSPVHARDDVPPELDALLARALRSLPGDRPRDAGQMLLELASIAHRLERPVTAPEVGAWARCFAPVSVVPEADALDHALQNLLGGNERARTATALPQPGLAFVARVQEDGTTVWEPAGPLRPRRRPAVALAASALVLVVGAGLLAVRMWSHAPVPPRVPPPAVSAAAVVPASAAPVRVEAPSIETHSSPAPPHARAAAPPAAPGFLNVYADPWAYVRVDGKPVGTTPLLRLPLAAGSHRVQLESPNAQSTQRQVRIGAGETQLISVDLAGRAEQ
jgi:tRNA A-37 threonylcarbamoyl transferase component Bud32